MTKKWLLYGAVVVLVFGGYIVYQIENIRDIFSKKEQPAEPALQLTLGSTIDTRLYELAGGALSEISSGIEGSVVSRSRRFSPLNATVSAIAPPNSLGAVLVLENQEGTRRLDDASSMKDTVALSKDNALVAYAELDVPSGSILYSENVVDWRVRVLNTVTGDIQDLGVGYAPHFILTEPAIIAFSSSEGIVAVTLESEERVVVPAFPALSTARSARFSPDGNYFAAYNTLTDYWSLFQVDEPLSLSMSAVGEVQSAFDLIALSDEHFYGIYRDETSGEMTLWRYALSGIAPFMRLEDGEHIYTFGEGELPYQIIP